MLSHVCMSKQLACDIRTDNDESQITSHFLLLYAIHIRSLHAAHHPVLRMRCTPLSVLTMSLI